MKVLRIIYDLQVGGVQRMLLQTLPLLREKGVETDICCLKREGDLASQFRDLGFTIHVIPLHSRMDPIGLFQLRRLVHRLSYQIIHAHMYASNMAANAALLGTHRVAIINSYHSQKPFLGRRQALMCRLTRKIPDQFIAVSDVVRGELIKMGFPPEKITVIHNGIVCPNEPIPLPEKSAGAALEVLWAGRFVKQKRIAMLIELLALSRQESIPVHLTLVGDGPLLSEMKQKVKENGLEERVTFTGWKSDIKPYIDRAEIYLSASHREGFPNTLLEVCACGRGFLVADIPPNREVIGSHRAGFLLGDYLPDWMTILKRLYNNREEIRTLSCEAFQIALEYTIERTCEKTIALYERLISGGC